MAGRKKTPAPPCFSAAASNRRWRLYSVAKIRRLSCLSSGRHVRTSIWSTRATTPGTTCSSKAFSCSSVSSRTAASRFTSRMSHQQIRFTRTLSSGNSFVAFVDAVGELDGTPCVLEWKTASARYPEEPDGIAALDPQLVCYSWMTGINDVAQVVFVRKRMVEVQYLRATITDQQRQEFETLVDDTVRRIESGLFLPHSGIRFPQNPCTTCPFLGLCLDQRDLVEAGLIRKPGVDLGLFDELGY